MRLRGMAMLALALGSCQKPPEPPFKEGVRDRSPGWHAPFECYWERFNELERHEGWIADDRDFYGTSIVFASELAEQLPTSRNLRLFLRADDNDEPVEVRGFHGPNDARFLVSVQFTPEVRSALGQPQTISIWRGEHELARLDMTGGPSEEELAACDPPNGARPYPVEWDEDER